MLIDNKRLYVYYEGRPMKRFTIEISKELHKEFKAWCAKNEVTMRAEIVRLMTTRVEQQTDVRAT